MKISHEEMLKRLSSPNNLVHLSSNPPPLPVAEEESPSIPEDKTVEHRDTQGHRKGPRANGWVPEPLRDAIGVMAETLPGTVLSEAFEVSKSVVSTARTGNVGGKPPT